MFDTSDAQFKALVYASAKEYISKGWLLFPLHSATKEGKCTCGKESCGDNAKHPSVPRGLKEASNSPEQIEQWFGPEAPLRNIGLVTGEQSGLTVLDIDIGNGKVGDVSWAEACGENGEPVTLTAATGGGGAHFFFRFNSALKTASNVLGKGVDCRNDGGYVVAAPSRHRSGGVYSWISEESTPIANLPAHLSKRKETRGRPKGSKKDGMYNGKYTLKQVARMLEYVDATDRDLWRHAGVILGREFKRSEEAWEVYAEWSEKGSGGKKGRNHDEIMREAFFELSAQGAEKELSIGTLVKSAVEGGWAPEAGEVPIGHFVYYGPGNNYIYRPTASYWIAPAVDAAVSPVNEAGKIELASEWLKKNQLATSMTSDPSYEEDYLKGYDCRNGEVVEVVGGALFNTYKKPSIELGDAKLAHPFLEHVERIFNKTGDAEQFLNYMAHRVQRPWEKPRFALMIAGGQGVGKDTAVEFCCPSIGVWNVANIDPAAFESSFNEFAASTLVRISEAANLQDMNKWAFNERTKVLIAGSPDTCQINPKYGQKFSVRMYCGVIITTNHLAGGIHIPKDDRRYDVIEAASMDEMGIEDPDKRRQYFTDLWTWFLEGGASHVAAYLHAKDISAFSPSNGQRKTAAHRAVIQHGLERHGWFADIMEEVGWPEFISAAMIKLMAEKNGEDTKNTGLFSGRMKGAMEEHGYFKYCNPSVADGRWRKNKKLLAVYAKVGTVAGLDPTNSIEEAF